MRRNQSHSQEDFSPAKSAKISFISSMVACFCILIYLGSMALAGIRIFNGIKERRALAEKEFSRLAENIGPILDMESAVTDAILKSATLQGVIIAGVNRKYVFERIQGGIIAWNGDNPRFKSRFGLSKKPLVKQIKAQDEVQPLIFSAVYSYISDDMLIAILKRTLLVVLATLCLALFTLLFQFFLSTERGRKDEPPPGRPAPERDVPAGEDITPASADLIAKIRPDVSSELVPPPIVGVSPRSRISPEEQTEERLASELKRCASFEQDLVFMLIELAESDVPAYQTLMEEGVKFFLRRDLIFERGERGIAVILPSIDLDQGFDKSEKFQNRMQAKFSEVFEQNFEGSIGLSSRADRTIDAERLILEAAGALKKAAEDPASPIVAFRSDPEKYKAFIDAQNKNRS